MVEKFIISLRKKSERKLDKLIIENSPPNLSLSRTKIQDLIKRNMIFDPKKQNFVAIHGQTSISEGRHERVCRRLFFIYVEC